MAFDLGGAPSPISNAPVEARRAIGILKGTGTGGFSVFASVPKPSNPSIHPRPVSAAPTDWASQIGELIGGSLGPKGLASIEKLAEKFPPELDPDLFIEECKKLLTPVLGAAKVNKILEQLDY